MSPRKNARVAFVSAVAVLLLSAVAAYVTIARLRESAQWVVHTYQVDGALGEVDSSLAALARARTGYVIHGTPSLIEEFNTNVPLARQKLKDVRALTSDNTRQQENCTRLEDLTEHRLEIFLAVDRIEKIVPKRRPRSDRPD